MEFIAGFACGALLVVAVPRAFDLASSAWAAIKARIGK